MTSLLSVLISVAVVGDIRESGGRTSVAHSEEVGETSGEAAGLARQRFIQQAGESGPEQRLDPALLAVARLLTANDILPARSSFQDLETRSSSPLALKPSRRLRPDLRFSITCDAGTGERSCGTTDAAALR